MFLKFCILFLFLCLAVKLNAESAESFSSKCFTIVQPLLQDIADKRLKYDNCDKTIEDKNNKLSETQLKLDQIQTKLSIAETVVKEKQRQIGHHAELCNTHKNNSLIKDELLKSYKTHIDTNADILKSKDEHINKLQTEAEQNVEIFKNYKTQIVTHKAELELLKAKSADDLGNFTTHIKQKEAQMQQLSTEVNRTKKELESHKTELSNKNEELNQLQTKVQTHNAELNELSNKLKTKEEQLANLQEYYKQVKDQLEAAESQITSNLLGINQQQIVIESLTTDLNDKDTQLLKCQSKIEMLQLPNCYWYGNSSDVQKIRAPDIEPFEVLCDAQLAGPGWTVIQRRLNGSENFYRNWTEYRAGFGNLQSEFFIGLEKLHRLTIAQPYELYVHLESFDNQTYSARYSDFRVGSELEAYELKSVGRYSGDAGDGLLYAKNRKFTTYDADHDRDTINCAVERHGGWWYDRCGHSNLNGKYFDTAVKHSWSINWLGVQSFSYKSVQMMLRPAMVK